MELRQKDQQARYSDFWLNLVWTLAIVSSLVFFSFVLFVDNKEAMEVMNQWWVGVVEKLLYCSTGIGLIYLFFKISRKAKKQNLT
ncbi:MAG: hypothetical protein ACI8Q1_003604 [Parvicella sp.]|jgi:hypothetical protein